MSDLIEAHDLSCAIGSRTVVEQVNLAVRAGEVLALIGPNGAGKTTLLRTLARLLKPSAGSVMIEGVRLGSCKADNWRANWPSPNRAAPNSGRSRSSRPLDWGVRLIAAGYCRSAATTKRWSNECSNRSGSPICASARSISFREANSAA